MKDKYTERVINAIAEAKGSKPSEWDFVVQNYIDLDAINRLARHNGASWTLSFEIPNHRVVITSDGTVFVDNIKKDPSRNE